MKFGGDPPTRGVMIFVRQKYDGQVRRIKGERAKRLNRSSFDK